jgi:hypothetical protein
MLIVVASVLMLAAVAGGLAVYFSVRALRNATAAPRAATEAYMRDLQRGDTTAAYQSLCTASRKGVTQEQFEQVVGRQKPTTFALVDTRVRSANGAQSAQVTVRLTYATGLGEQKIFTLRPEDGTWKICDGSYD